MSHTQPPRRTPDWLVGGGEAGELIRSIDWAATTLGPRDTWPLALRVAVNLVVESRIPTALLWGRSLVLLYNDAYAPICADRHPAALGRPGRDVWHEVWHINRPIFEAVLERGESVYLEDRLFPIDRDGRRQDAYFTLSYSPLRDGSGAISGTLVTLIETTGPVLERRALAAERDQVADALREREERLRLVMDATGIGAFDFDPRTGQLEWSAHAKRHFGLPPHAEVNYDTFLRGLHPDDRARVNALVEHVLRPESGGQYATEYRTVGIEDGQERWLAAWGRVTFDAEGEPARFLGVTLDITERKRAEHIVQGSEAELARERTFLRTVIDSVSSMVVVRDRLGCCLLANETAAQFHGMTAQTMEGMDCHEIPTFPTTVFEHDLEVLETGRPTTVELELVGGDGLAHALVTYRTPLTNSEGVRDRVLATTVDITWRKRAETELKRQREEYRRLAENSPEVIARFDRELRHTYVNEYGASVYGLPREDVIGKTNAEIGMPADKVAFWAEQFAAVFESGVQRTVEFEFDSPTYGHQYLSALFVPERNESGEIESILAITRDVTESRSSQRALAEREADLRLAVGRLAEADRRKDEFIAILSHELRNPLAPIRYALPVLQKERLSSPATRAVAVIDRQISHLTRLVDDLLDVSRITRGKIDLHLEQVSLQSIITAATEAASPSVVSARHVLGLDVPDEPIWLRADAARVAQVVTNLLNNSAKYTPRGGRIRLKAYREEEFAVVTVCDNGIGIPREELPNVFEMFRQVSRPEKSQGGLGIGLALVKRLVEMHGGAIEAHSAGEGRGAEFVVRLPVAPAGSGDEGRPKTHRAAPVAGRRLKVLVVDDNADLVDMLSLVVERAGHDVRRALDGRSAVAAAVSYRPDVVLLDLGLPVMTGIEVARELRRHPDTAAARLVALTGWGQAEDRRLTQTAGFDTHLTKPTDPHALTQLLAAIAARSDLAGKRDDSWTADF